MNIVYALDDGYKLYTAVSIYSLLSNKNKESEYKIHILHHPDLDIHYFDKLQQHFNTQFNFVDMGDTAKDLFISRHIKTPTYYRLWITEVLPNMDRCIYLDGDTIIHKDLTELYNTDLGDNIVGGVYDLPGKIGKYKEKEKNNRPLIYVNAGVLLMDLNNFKKYNVVKLMKNWMENNINPLYHDQDIINFSLQGFIKLLPTIYNFYNVKYMYENLEVKIYMFELFKQIDPMYDINKFNSDYNNRVITHYICKPIGDYKQTEFGIFIDEWYVYFNKFLELLDNKSDEYVICTCAKNEANYIVEWVNYHLKLGFDQIYIHNNDDNQIILKQLLGDNDKVTLIDYSGKKAFRVKMIENFYVIGKFKWCAFIDCGEFITLNGFNNIKDYINKFPEDCHQILLHWLCYGANKEKKHKSIPIQKQLPFCGTPIEQKQYQSDVPLNYTFKSIIKKTNMISRIRWTSHSLFKTNTYINNFTKITNFNFNNSKFNNYDVAFIKHYFIRDLKEFMTQKLLSVPHNYNIFEDISRFYSCYTLMNPSLSNELLKLANIPNKLTNELISKKILCKNQEKLLLLLKKDLNVVYCGDLKNNNIFINIANYNKCYYSWVLPELFNNVYKESDFEVIIN